ncbi:NADH:ubiquinone oxidoreductase subunit NDUFA12 [Pararhizobium sp. IMCC21322]|uniref:NADH:ubiquinone oxidoreductase subunit NDUFA12 n=1 Tax=Pararhizobium sp. IMCC21322 TaxID=3067903 RepID=UPI0027409A0B|nr:NADH:ubiquinone oxidoreductase subunit NDUFA12 [Pararhizobium sp. IMCC21322]
MKNFFLRFFTWWNGHTVGTNFYLWRKGERVGEDELGNVYYRAENDKRRMVMYNGEADASKIPAGWHAWMHHRTDTAPVDQNYVAKDWQLPHQANMTGSALAYRPPGSIMTKETRPQVAGDYEPWTP